MLVLHLQVSRVPHYPKLSTVAYYLIFFIEPIRGLIFSSANALSHVCHHINMFFLGYVCEDGMTHEICNKPVSSFELIMNDYESIIWLCHMCNLSA